jgi:hypothetical protein
MPRYKFAWSNLPSRLLKELSTHLDVDPAYPSLVLRRRYGTRPREEFIRLARPVLEGPWLAQVPTALDTIVNGLWHPGGRDGYLRPSGRQRQLERQ